MEPISNAHSQMQLETAAGPQTRNPAGKVNADLRNGSTAAPAAAAETSRPVAQAGGASRSTLDLASRPVADQAEERVAAARRAYMREVRAAGLNLRDNPAP